MIYLPTAKLRLSAPRLSRNSAGSFNGRTPRLGRGNLSSSLSPAANQEPKKHKSLRNGPGKHWQNKPAVIIFPDGRERCNPGTPEGRAEYLWRKIQMYVRQIWPGWPNGGGFAVCCNCRKPMSFAEATWEHEFGRHASRIDERLVNPETGKPQNGLSHLWCNKKRGSRKTPIWHGTNVVRNLKDEPVILEKFREECGK